MKVSDSIKKILATSRVAGAAGIGFALSAGHVFAQNAASEPVVLEEVVVTAQFREQGLQKTPVAITAVNAEQLQQRSATAITDVAAFAPNVVSTPGSSGFGPVAQTYIRGVGQNDGSFALEPGVGIYVDDVYNGILLGSVFDLLDIDRVEVLRGPQGTLAGKNSLGGAIKLFSKKPDGDGGGYVEATYGEFNRTDVRAGGNFTLLEDKLYARVAGVSKHRDGYLDRLDFACVNPGSGAPNAITSRKDCKIGTEGGQDLQAVRVALRWLATDDIEDNFIADVTQDRSETAATKMLVLNNPQVPNSAAFITGAGQLYELRHVHGAELHRSGELPRPPRAPARTMPSRSTRRHRSTPTACRTSWSGSCRTICRSPRSPATAGMRARSRRTTTAARTRFSSSAARSPTASSRRSCASPAPLSRCSTTRLAGTTTTRAAPRAASASSAPASRRRTSSSPTTTSRPRASRRSRTRCGARRTRLSVIAGVRYTEEEKDYLFGRLNPYAPGPSYTGAGSADGLGRSLRGRQGRLPRRPRVPVAR